MKSLSISKREVLRYLGYRNQRLDENNQSVIDDCINEMIGLAEGRHVYKFFEMDKEFGKIGLKNSDLILRGKDIYNHLKQSNTCILMAATLGSEVDRRIRYYEKTNMTKALILDACASTAIEEVCDNVCRELEAELMEQYKTLTSRFSPGYGDLPIELQRNFISVLEADRIIGLTSSSSNILIPRKSVTVIMGIIDKDDKIEEKGCINCSKYTSCQFRREGAVCGV